MSFTELGTEEIARRLFRFERVFQPLASPAEFGPEHLDAFRCDGFVAIEGMFSADEVRAAQLAIRRLIVAGGPEQLATPQPAAKPHIYLESSAPARELAPSEREPFVRKLQHFVAADACLAGFAEQPLFRRIVEQLVGRQPG